MKPDESRLVFSDPDSRRPLVEIALYPPMGQHLKSGFRDLADQLLDRNIQVRQRNNKIDHHLPGAMIGEPAPPIGFHDFDPLLFQDIGGEQKIVEGVFLFANSDDRRMLDKEEQIIDLGPQARLAQTFLQTPRLFISSSPQIGPFHITGGNTAPLHFVRGAPSPQTPRARTG